MGVTVSCSLIHLFIFKPTSHTCDSGQVKYNIGILILILILGIRVFGPKRDEVTGEWRKLHNEELSDLYFLPNIVRVVKSGRMRWAGHVACIGGGRGVHRVLVGKPKGKRSIGETQTQMGG